MFKTSKKLRQQKMKYQKSGKGRKVHNKANKKYKQTKKGKMANKEHQKTEKYKTAMRKYLASEKGKTTSKKYRLWTKYQLTIEQHKDMYISQNGCCAVCGESIPYEKTYTDHNHTTGKVRGLLCNGCNLLVGLVENSSGSLESILKYLEANI